MYGAHVLPPSVEYQETVLAMTIRSGFFVSGSGIGRSPPPMRPAGRESVVMRVQVSPASSLRKMPVAPRFALLPGSFANATAA